jgi:hypothetical protein
MDSLQIMRKTINLFSFYITRIAQERKPPTNFLRGGTSLSIYYLATIEVYKDRPTDSPLKRHGPHRKVCIHKFFYCCVYLLVRNVFI